uniref:Glycosyltransferase family 61 protein n=1 Tax=viral metagenome TaxID=1070528 RepID=A0A6C0IA62_9ZZZZ
MELTLDNCEILPWVNENISYSNKDNVYNNVYLHTGTIVTGQWQNSICFCYINDKLKVISNSNSYISIGARKWHSNYNNIYKIYDNLINNYKDILSVDLSTIIDLDNDKYISLLNPFNFSNSGHDLSIVLDNVHYIYNNNIKNILIYKNYKDTNNFKLLNLLLPDDYCFIELDENKIYNIKNLIILPQKIMYINGHQYLIDKLITIIKNKYYNSDLCDKNIVLIKSNRNKNVMLKATQVHCEEMLKTLENNGYLILIPEEMNIFDLCIYLLYAKKIVFSTGSIVYTNHLFFNKNGKLIFINRSENEKPIGRIDSTFKSLTYKNNPLSKEECDNFAEQIINY